MKTTFEPFYEHLVQHLAEGVCFIDLQQKISLWNHAAEQMTGLAAEETLGSACCGSILTRSITLSNPQEELICPFDRAISDRADRAYRLELEHQAGHRKLLNLKVIPVAGPSSPLGVLGLLSDTSDTVELEAMSRSMQSLMRIDPLTHLPNQKALFDSMKGEYLRFVRYGTPFALIAVAAASGDRQAQTGPDRDAFLKWFGQLLSYGFRKADTPGRLRGSAFLILLPHANTQAAEKAAKKMQSLFANTPYPATGKPVMARFGCASITRSDTLDRLLDRAKKALKMALDQQGEKIISL